VRSERRISLFLKFIKKESSATSYSTDFSGTGFTQENLEEHFLLAFDNFSINY
jgi:hypothetical protein